MALFKSFFGPDNHVRISDLGQKVLDDKTLAAKIADAIIEKRHQLENGETVQVPDSNGGIFISLSTNATEE